MVGAVKATELELLVRLPLIVRLVPAVTTPDEVAMTKSVVVALVLKVLVPLPEKVMAGIVLAVVKLRLPESVWVLVPVKERSRLVELEVMTWLVPSCETVTNNPLP